MTGLLAAPAQAAETAASPADTSVAAPDKSCDGKMTVKAKQSSRNSAANYAYNNFRGKSYDKNFVANKFSGDSWLTTSGVNPAVWKELSNAWCHGSHERCGVMTQRSPASSASGRRAGLRTPVR